MTPVTTACPEAGKYEVCKKKKKRDWYSRIHRGSFVGGIQYEVTFAFVFVSSKKLEVGGPLCTIVGTRWAFCRCFL